MVNPTPPGEDPRAKLLSAFKAGDVIFHEGHPGGEMFIIDDGEVEIVKQFGAEERSLSTLGPGDFFGEMSLLEDLPRVASARAKSDCRLLQIDASTFDQLLRDNPEISIRMLRRMSRRLRRYEQEEVRAVGVAAEVLGGVSRTEMGRLQAVKVADDEKAAAGAVARFEHAASGRSFAVAGGAESRMIGRFDPVTELSPDIDLTEVDSQRSLSRRHARLVLGDGRFLLREEIGTANGTFVQGTRLPTGVDHELKDGDLVRFGRVDCVFHVGPGA